jgi:HEAT repeat protein
MVHALCRSRAAKSLLAHDLFRRWGAAEKSDWSGLLKSEWSDDGWVLLLLAAGASGRSEWTDLIAKHANHESPIVVKAALCALENLGEPKGAVIAGVACEHTNAQVRRQAVKTLEACGELDESYGSLLKLLMDESFEVRRAAFDGIIKLGGRSRLSELVPVDHWQSELFKEEGIIAP